MSLISGNPFREDPKSFYESMGKSYKETDTKKSAVSRIWLQKQDDGAFTFTLRAKSDLPNATEAINTLKGIQEIHNLFVKSGLSQNEKEIISHINSLLFEIAESPAALQNQETHELLVSLLSQMAKNPKAHDFPLNQLFDALVRFKEDPKAKEALAALSISYLSGAYNSLNDFLLEVPKAQDPSFFLQLARSDDLKRVRAAIEFLESEGVSNISRAANQFYGISDQRFTRLIKWQKPFDEATFSMMLSDTKAILGQFDLVARKLEKVDMAALAEVFEAQDVFTGSWELMNAQRHTMEYGSFTSQDDAGIKVDSLSRAPLISLLKTVNERNAATSKLLANENNAPISNAIKKDYLSDLSFSLQDAREYREELLSFLKDILAAAKIEDNPEEYYHMAAAVREAISELRKGLREIKPSENEQNWSVNLYYTDRPLLNALKNIEGIHLDDQRTFLSQFTPENDKVVVTYDHGECTRGMHKDLDSFERELSSLEKEFESIAPTKQGATLSLSDKTIFDFVGKKLTSGLSHRDRAKQKPSELSERTKQILRILFPLLELTDSAIKSSKAGTPFQANQNLTPDERKKIQKEAQVLYRNLMHPDLRERPELLQQLAAKTPDIAPYMERFQGIKNLNPELVREVVTEFIQDREMAILSKPLQMRIPETKEHEPNAHKEHLAQVTSEPHRTPTAQELQMAQDAKRAAQLSLSDLRNFDAVSFNTNAQQLKEFPNWTIALTRELKKTKDLLPFEEFSASNLRGFDLQMLHQILDSIPEAEALAKSIPSTIVRTGDTVALGSGAVNTVYKVTIDGQPKIFKPDPQDAGFTTQLKESYFGTAQASGIPAGAEAQFPYRAVAASKVDELLYKDERISVVTEFAHINGKRGILMSMAKGRSPQMTGTKEEPVNLAGYPHIQEWVETRIKEKGSLTLDELQILASNLKYRKIELKGEPSTGKWELIGTTAIFKQFNPDNPTTCEGLLKLQIKDVITGEVDRHPGNYFIDPDTGKITGVDEDCSFGVHSMPEHVDVREQSSILYIIPNKASLMLRMPAVITKDIQAQVEELYKNQEQLVQALTPLLTPQEIDASLVRLKKLHDHVHDSARCLVVSTKEELLSPKARQRMDSNNSYWAREMMVLDKDQKGWNHLRAGIPSREIIEEKKK